MAGLAHSLDRGFGICGWRQRLIDVRPESPDELSSEVMLVVGVPKIWGLSLNGCNAGPGIMVHVVQITVRVPLDMMLETVI